MTEFPSLEAWNPFEPEDVIRLMQPVQERWWFSGGYALELHMGYSWRDRSDIDIGVCRCDLAGLRPLLGGHELIVAAGGAIAPWGGEPLDVGHNNLWVRRGEAWGLDISIGAGDAERWVYRRAPALSLPWDRAVQVTNEGMHYLAPALQLLFKSRDVRSKDTRDAEEVIPGLKPEERALLAETLPLGHPWHSLIKGVRETAP